MLEEPDLRPEAAKIISVVGKSAVPNLIRQLQHQDSELRSTVTRTLVQIGEPATAGLTAALSNPSHLVRRNVAVALSQIDPDHADEFLMKRDINDLRDADNRVRANGSKLLKVSSVTSFTFNSLARASSFCFAFSDIIFLWTIA